MRDLIPNSIATPAVIVSAMQPASTTYAGSVSNGATETITPGTNINGNTTTTIAGTITAGDVVTLTTYNTNLTNGQEPVLYTVASGNTTTTIATNLTSAINADTNLKAIGVSATSSGAVITITVTGTTYTSSVSGAGTETIALGINTAGNTTAVIGGTPTTNDILTITTHNPSLSGGQESVNYTVLSTDTLLSIAAGLASAINADTKLQALGITGTNSTNATLAWSESFSANPILSSGLNNAAITAVDGGNNSKTINDQVSVNSATSQKMNKWKETAFLPKTIPLPWCWRAEGCRVWIVC